MTVIPLASHPAAPESRLARTSNCVECDGGREHTLCHVLHLVEDEWVIEYRPRGRVGASGQSGWGTAHGSSRPGLTCRGHAPEQPS